MYLSIYLRTHDGGNFHPGDRFVKNEKRDIVISCLRSLVESINFFDKVDETSLTIIDDHSSVDTTDMIKSIMTTCKAMCEFVPLEGRGNGDSLKKCYETALASGSNLIYFVEDDHLHKNTSIQFMVNAWEQFSKKLPNNQVVIAPYDDPVDYFPDRIIPTRIVTSSDCHWRQNFHSTCTMMLPKWVLLHFWDKFMAITNYGIDGISEENTINVMYRKEEVFLFTPIPFQAVHLQIIPPMIGDWESLYQKNNPNPILGGLDAAARAAAAV